MSSWCSLEGAIVNDGGFEDNATYNGSFWEAPLPVTDLTPHPYWTVSPAPQASPASVVASDTFSAPHTGLAPRTGNIAVSFGSEPNGAITQTLTTEIGKTYNLSLWLANPTASGTDNVFSVSWNGSLISLSAVFLTPIVAQPGTFVVTAQPNWFLVGATNLAVTGSSTPLVISASNRDWYTLVDDVTVQGVPEPSTVLMLGLGATLAGFRRRRQRGL